VKKQNRGTKMAYYGVELEKYIKDLHVGGNSLASAISSDAAFKDIKKLQSIVGIPSEKLDFSPKSLILVEEYLQKYYFSLEDADIQKPTEEAVQIVRGIGAYLGKVLEINLAGQWRSYNDELLKTQVIIQPRSEQTNSRKKGLTLGNSALATWARVVYGEKPGLYKTYNQATKKRMQQRI